jgi:hypothetical protein
MAQKLEEEEFGLVVVEGCCRQRRTPAMYVEDLHCASASSEYQDVDVVPEAIFSSSFSTAEPLPAGGGELAELGVLGSSWLSR